MSAPFLWIGLPVIVALILFALSQYERIVLIAGILFSLWLSWVAWTIPVDEAFLLGNIAIKLPSGLSVMGREFILTNPDRPFISTLYLLLAVWFLGGFLAQAGKTFVPLALSIVALLVGALAVEPFLYAALLIEIAVFIAIPLLSPAGNIPGPGLYRFLTFQTIGVPFILFTGWMLAGVEASPGNLDLVTRAGTVLGLGFAFLLAVFPFHSWIPMLAEEAHPYKAAFIFFFFPGMASLFAIGFLDRFVWLRDVPQTIAILQGVGAAMVLVAGGWAATSRSLLRIFGYTAVAEIGFSLLAISLAATGDLLIYFWLWFVRAFALILWAVALSRLRGRMAGDMRLASLAGVGGARPFLAIVLMLAQFSLAGLPLLAGFPPRFALWKALASEAPLAVVLSLVGALGLLGGAVRTFVTLFVEGDRPKLSPLELLKPDGTDPYVRQRRLVMTTLFGLAVLVFGVFGIYPQFVLSYLVRLLEMFSQLG